MLEFTNQISAYKHLVQLAQIAGSGPFGAMIARAFTLNHKNLQTKQYSGRKTA